MKIDLILEIVRKYYVQLLCIRCIQTTYELLKKKYKYVYKNRYMFKQPVVPTVL